MGGAILARGAPLVARIALVYALTDCSHEIGLEHLEAALEVWRYCADSARYLFAGRMGSTDADRLLEALVDGAMTRTAIRDLYQRHRTGRQIDALLAELETAGRIERIPSESTGGAPAEAWRKRQ